MTAAPHQAPPRKDKLLKVRVDEAAMRRYADAARRERKSVSEWLRDLADREAGRPGEGSRP